MNGILAQTAALTAHAKVYVLDPRRGGDEAYWAAHSTLKYVRSLAFVASKKRFFGQRDYEIASSATSWMRTLPAGCTIQLLSLGANGALPAQIATAFVGGTREAIAVSLNSSTSLWIPSEEFVGEKQPGTKVWRVQYRNVSSPLIPPGTTTVAGARERLAGILRDAAVFAEADEYLSTWGNTFRQAESALSAPNPIAPYHPDILPPEGYTLAARQLLAAAVGGFVFGGMGSWNDGGPARSESRSEYERLTTELYEAVLEALTTAVNGGLTDSLAGVRDGEHRFHE